MAKLTAASRNALPEAEFALPGRHYPIDTEDRARSALARGSAYATPSQLVRIKAAVKAKYPSMQIE